MSRTQVDPRRLGRATARLAPCAQASCTAVAAALGARLWLVEDDGPAPHFDIVGGEIRIFVRSLDPNEHARAIGVVVMARAGEPADGSWLDAFARALVDSLEARSRVAGKGGCRAA